VVRREEKEITILKSPLVSERGRNHDFEVTAGFREKEMKLNIFV